MNKEAAIERLYKAFNMATTESNVNIPGLHAVLDELIAAEREACAKVCKAVTACEPYLKDGETPLERIERAHHENLSLMTLLAKEKTKNETLDAECNDLACQLNESNERNGRLIAQRNELLEALKQIEPILARMYGSQVVPPMQIVCAAIANATGGAA